MYYSYKRPLKESLDLGAKTLRTSELLRQQYALIIHALRQEPLIGELKIAKLCFDCIFNFRHDLGKWPMVVSLRTCCQSQKT